jgi:hypothetical protein
MSVSKSFTYDELSVRVECPDQAHLTWLEEFLTPAFSAGEFETIDANVTLTIDDQRHAALLRAGARPNGRRVRGFILDKGPVELQPWTATAGERIFFDAEAEVFYCVGDDATRIADAVHPRARHVGGVDAHAVCNARRGL